MFINKKAFGFYYVQFDPEFTWSMFYEDNIYNDRHNKKVDFSNRYMPYMEFHLGTPRLSISGKTKVEIVEYMDEKEFNTVDQSHEITLSLKSDRRTELLFSSGYRVDSNTDRFFLDEISPGAEGGYTVRRHRDKTKFCSLICGHELSNRSRLSFHFIFSTYDTENTNDSAYYNAVIEYVYQLDKRTALKLNLAFNFFHFEFSNDPDNESLFPEDISDYSAIKNLFISNYVMKTCVFSCGLAYKLMYNFMADLSIGRRYTETDIKTETERIIKTRDKIIRDTASKVENNIGEGTTLSLSLIKDFQYSRIRLRANQNVGINPDMGDAYEQRWFSLDACHVFSRRLSGFVSLQYHLHDSDKDDEFGYSIDRNYIFFKTEISYMYNNRLTVGLNYSHSRTEDNLRLSETKRNTFCLMVNFKLAKPLTF
jgi:hypothetical protein